MTTDANRADNLPVIQRAMVALEKMRSKLDKIERDRTEPIAILGMACRFPGGATTPEAFWRLLDTSGDAVTEVPRKRWPLDPLEDGDAQPLHRAARWGAFLESVDRFDAPFFGISPREAASLDPQQRILLEVAWEALERAGQVPARLAGSRTGVFLGIMNNDYLQLSLAQAPEDQDVYSVTGNGHSFPPGRISYTLGLEGPSIAIDTACSSSLVAVHLACQSLRQRESGLALAGGVSLMLVPESTSLMAQMQALSPDGRCRAFDARANGYVRGEGCGVVVLKRLSAALRDGDPVLALIRGSAVNQDGRSTGLTAPNVLSQEALLRQALESGRVEPSDIGYVETHGTGTALGDPIELEALAAVLGAPRTDGSTCTLGAVKTNIGHLEAAAGIAGLIKAVLCLDRQAIPPNLHFETLNPRLSLEGTAFAIAAQKRPWPPVPGKPRLAGVSSFGLSGTNAHVVLQEAPPPAPGEQPGDGVHLVPLSAKTPEALAALAEEYCRFLSEDPPASLRDLAYTACVRRTHHEHRWAVAGRSRDELLAGLERLARRAASPGAARVRAVRGTRPRVVFVFPGQGSQWLGMGRTLLAEEKAFREAIETCDAAFAREAGFSVLEELEADEEASRLARIDVLQPVLVAVEIGLAALWRSFGVEPDAVIGHSMGEVAAAHAAGALSLEDAARVICRRSRLLRKVSGQGAMALVELALGDAEAELADFTDRLSAAVSNGPRSTVIGGDPAALDEVLARLEEREVFCRRVKVDVASHSPQMDPLLDELRSVLVDLSPKQSTVPMHSTVTGEPLVGPELVAAYWADNLREPVRFSAVVQALIDDGHALFVEMSPHPILLPSIEENLSEKGVEGAAVASLRRDADERGCLLDSLGALYTFGHPLDGERLFPGGGSVVAAPTYPWQRERCWIHSAAPRAGASKARTNRTGGHPLLGRSFSPSTMPGSRFWEIDLDLPVAPYLSDHQVLGGIVLPAAAYVDLVLAAARTLAGDESLALEDMALTRPIVLGEGEPRSAELALTRESAGLWEFRISSRAPGRDGDGEWALHATGKVRLESVESAPAAGAPCTAETPAAVQERCAEEIAGEDLYDRLAERGLELGPAFRGVERAWKGEGESLGRLHLAPELAAQAGAHLVHPALLDAALQVLVLAAPDDDNGGLRVLTKISRLRCLAPARGEVFSHAQLCGDRGAKVALIDASGRAFVEIEGIGSEQVEGAAISQPDQTPFVAPGWQPAELAPDAAPRAAPTPSRVRWLLLAGETELAEEISAALSDRGRNTLRVAPLDSSGPSRAGAFSVDPTLPGELDEVLRHALEDGAAPEGIIYLWGAEAPQAEPLSAAALQAAQARGCVGVLHLIQALARAGWRDPPRLCVMTRGSQAIDGEPGDVAIAQAPLWGLGRTIALEHPELRCLRIDLDPAAPAGEGRSVAQEILAEHHEEEIAFRAGRRFAGRLARVPDIGPSSAPAPAVRSDGTYLVTGGLGGLGLLAARWLAEDGAKHLVLVGRRGATTEAQGEAIAALRATGVQVMVASADVSDAGEVERLLGEIDARMPALCGVVHAAGVLEDGLLVNQDMAGFQKVLAPKVLGAFHLHEQTRHRPLDLFVLYSSAAALFGAPGLGNYVAGNAFLDALAHSRRRLGLPALSIDWGLFGGIGMGLKAESAGRAAQRGLRDLDPEEGAALFRRLLESGTTQMGAMHFDARQWLEFHLRAASSERFAPLVQGARRARQAATRKAGALLASLRRAAREERTPLLEQFVREQVAAVLRTDPSRVDPRAPLRDLGLDSIMGLELRNCLESGLGTRLSATLIWTYPTVSALAEHLASMLGENAERPRSGTGQAPLGPDPSVPDDALLAAFDESIQRIERGNRS